VQQQVCIFQFFLVFSGFSCRFLTSVQSRAGACTTVLHPCCTTTHCRTALRPTRPGLRENAGNHWYLRFYQDAGTASARKRQRVKIAPASMPEREVRKLAAEMLRPVNQGLITVGSAINFSEYVQTVYNPTNLPLLATTTQDSYRGMIAKYLEPRFGSLCLRDLTPLTLQRYFSSLAGERLAFPTILKVRDTLSSILRSAVRYGFLVQNPMDGLLMPPDKEGDAQSHTSHPNSSMIWWSSCRSLTPQWPIRLFGQG
jgi:hypothetical protein